MKRLSVIMVIVIILIAIISCTENKASSLSNDDNVLLIRNYTEEFLSVVKSKDYRFEKLFPLFAPGFLQSIRDVPAILRKINTDIENSDEYTIDKIFSNENNQIYLSYIRFKYNKDKKYGMYIKYGRHEEEGLNKYVIISIHEEKMYW